MVVAMVLVLAADCLASFPFGAIANFVFATRAGRLILEEHVTDAMTTTGIP